MVQQHRLGTVHTTVSNDDTHTIITYHSTQVVKFSSSEIILNTGGWRSDTTKTRMNQASSQFNLGYRVFQKEFTWYVNFAGKTYKFESNTIKLKR